MRRNFKTGRWPNIVNLIFFKNQNLQFLRVWLSLKRWYKPDSATDKIGPFKKLKTAIKGPFCGFYIKSRRPLNIYQFK